MRDMQERPMRVVERDMPHSEQSETLVIAELVDHPDLFDKVSELLRPDDFYVDKYRAIYETLLKFYQQHGDAPDTTALTSLLQNKGDLDQLHDIDEALDRKDHLFQQYKLKQCVQDILDTAMQRRAIFASHKLATIGYHTTSAEKISREVENLLYQVTLAHAPLSDFEHVDDILQGCVTDIEKANKNRGKILGIPTGFTDLDAMTSGLQRTDLILLAARPSMGKTSLGMNIGLNAAKRGYVVAVFSLEMGKKQLGMRLLALESGISSSNLRSGWVEDDEWERVVAARDRIGEHSIYIDDTVGAPVSSIKNKLRRLKAKTGKAVDLVIVDYLGLMGAEDDSSAHRENRNQEISQISSGLKGVARDFNVPVLALAQLSRAVESRQTKIPQLSDLRDSGSLEQDADVVMFVYRDDYYAGYDQDGKSKSNRPGTADIIIAKHRNGPVGEFCLKFNAPLTRFDNMEVSPDGDDQS